MRSGTPRLDAPALAVAAARADVAGRWRQGGGARPASWPLPSEQWSRVPGPGAGHPRSPGAPFGKPGPVALESSCARSSARSFRDQRVDGRAVAGPVEQMKNTYRACCRDAVATEAEPTTA